MATLWQGGIDKACAGLTTVAELRDLGLGIGDAAHVVRVQHVQRVREIG